VKTIIVFYHWGKANDRELANVTPVFKKGSKSSPSNYSLTVNLCKVLASSLNVNA